MNDLIQIITNLGIGGFALFILWKQNDSHAKQLDERDCNYRNFVNENNHKMTNLVIESTKTIIESTETIKKTGEMIGSFNESVKELTREIRNK